jgi:hypothetical protein
MANIINNNFNFYKFKPYRGEYWDVVINKDMPQIVYSSTSELYDDNLIAYFDLSNASFTNNEIASQFGYEWNGAYSQEYVLENIGYTSFDNGLLYFERDKIGNEDFLHLYCDSNYQIHQDDKSLKMHFVTGSTQQYSYDYNLDDDGVKFNGGFLQGFFKTQCNKYETLPSKFKDGDCLTLEFVLKPSSDDENKLYKLNDKYPNNKGFFFYIGTRAENKWIYLYDYKESELSYDDYIEDGSIDIKKHKISSFNDMEFDMIVQDEIVENKTEDELFFDDYIEEGEKIERCDGFGNDYVEGIDECECEFNYIENELNISDFEYQTRDKSLTIGVYEEYQDYKNPFLLLNRTCDGFNVNDWDKNSSIRYITKRYKQTNENLFLLFNRTSSGYNVNTIDEINNEVEEYDIYADLYENALGFRITDSGAIGYRYLIKNCNKENKLEVVEAYSKDNIIKYDEWNDISIKVMFVKNEMMFKFYANGNLVFISKFLPKINLRELDEIYEKQEGVPFSISIGGGTQGLAETILPNYMLNPYRTYPLEELFGGSFIGHIKMFKIRYN